VGVDGASAANQTWLRCDVFEMRFITQSSRLDEREFAIVDLAWSCVVWALARAVAMAATLSLKRCMGYLHIYQVEAHRTRF
jgi:hypothetical protein